MYLKNHVYFLWLLLLCIFFKQKAKSEQSKSHNETKSKHPRTTAPVTTIKKTKKSIHLFEPNPTKSVTFLLFFSEKMIQFH
jgi:hypothetical protein